MALHSAAKGSTGSTKITHLAFFRFLLIYSDSIGKSTSWAQAQSSLFLHIYKNTWCCPQISVEQARNQTSAAEIQYSSFKKCTLFPTQTQRGKLRDDKEPIEHQSCPQKKGHPAAQSVEPHISYFKSLLPCELLGLMRKLLGNINCGNGNTRFLKLL